MKRIFLDIETLPTDEANREFVERKLRKSLARKETLLTEGEFTVEANKYFQNTALHGSLGRLLCIGLIVEENGKILFEGVFGMDKETFAFHLDEKQTLQNFWNFLKNIIRFDFEEDNIIGHNILGFDLPFLYQRSMIFQVKPSFQFLNGKPWEIEKNVFDTMAIWKMGKYKENVGLEEFALSFGLDCPKQGEVSGENLFQAFLDERHKEIREYCLNDVRCTRQLYYRMTNQTPPETKIEKAPEMALCR